MSLILLLCYYHCYHSSSAGNSIFKSSLLSLYHLRGRVLYFNLKTNRKTPKPMGGGGRHPSLLWKPVRMVGATACGGAPPGGSQSPHGNRDCHFCWWLCNGKQTHQEAPGSQHFETCSNEAITRRRVPPCITAWFVIHSADW